MADKLFRIDLQSESDPYDLSSLTLKQQLKRLNELCEKGDVKAMRSLGMMLVNGVDVKGREVERDSARGYKLLKQASDAGDAMAMVLLGLCYQVGFDGLEKDGFKARELFEKAAGSESAVGKYYLANIMTLDPDGNVNEKGIFTLLEAAADAGLIEAKLRLSDLYYIGIGTKRSVKKAIAILDELAAAGIPEAYYQLSRIYEDKGSHRSDKKALDYLDKAYKNDVPEACLALAERCESGDLVKMDLPRALHLYRRYLDHMPSDIHARYKIAELILLSGFPLEESYEGEALDCLDKAAAQDYPPALLTLGFFHLRGEHGFPKDDKKARDYFMKAGHTGNVQALILLGRFYRDGILFVRDTQEAIRYFRRASESKDPEGLCELGRMYRDGEGVPRNKLEAMNYFKQAALRGSPCASFEYGRMLADSKDKESVKNGLSLVEASAKAGVVEAMIYMHDYLLKKGPKITKSEIEKATYYIHAASAVTAALMYTSGEQNLPEGTLAEPEGAFRLLRSAVDGFDDKNPDGRIYIFCALGLCYESGIGCKPDIKAAVELYKKGQALKDPNSVLMLSQLYRKGLGVPQDIKKADELAESVRSHFDKNDPKHAGILQPKSETENEVTLGADFVFSGKVVQ